MPTFSRIASTPIDSPCPIGFGRMSEVRRIQDGRAHVHIIFCRILVSYASLFLFYLACTLAVVITASFICHSSVRPRGSKHLFQNRGTPRTKICCGKRMRAPVQKNKPVDGLDINMSSKMANFVFLDAETNFKSL